MKTLTELSQELYRKVKDKLKSGPDLDAEVAKWNEIAARARTSNNEKGAALAEKKLKELARKAVNKDDAEEILKKKLKENNILSFNEWNNLKEMIVHDAAGKPIKVKKVPVRMASGKIEMQYPGKSGSSGGGD